MVNWVSWRVFDSLASRRNGVFEVRNNFFGNKTDAAIGQSNCNGGAAGNFTINHDAGWRIRFYDYTVSQKASSSILESANVMAAKRLPHHVSELEAGARAVGNGYNKAIFCQWIEELLIG